MNAERAIKAYRREPTDRIPHWEAFSCPDAIQLITGVDPWEKPKTANQELIKKYSLDVWNTPLEDKPMRRLEDGAVEVDEEGRETARWGQERTWHWDWGKKFATIDDVLCFDPLQDLDFRWMDPIGIDLTPEVDELAVTFQKQLDDQREANRGYAVGVHGLYNTLYMWPLLTFGWENFLELGASYPTECKRLLRDFAVISRKIFQAWSKTDLEAFYSHDDICFQRGPVFSPKWLSGNIYPYYEEFWGYLKEAGKVVYFVCDGNTDQVNGDVVAAGADGIFAESYTDLKDFKRRHPDKILLGGGDNQILKTGDRELIEGMVKDMTELGKDMPGYFYCVGNHIPWDVPAESAKLYFDLCEEYGRR
jgi:hypothetical protein